MAGIEGLYSSINAYINERKENGYECIHVKQVMDAVKNDINVYAVAIETVVDSYIMGAVETQMNKHGYRVEVKGTGLFVHPEMVKHPTVLARLYNNKSIPTQKAQLILSVLGRLVEKADIDGQLRFDFENQTYIEDLTTEELIEFCLNEAYREA